MSVVVLECIPLSILFVEELEKYYAILVDIEEWDTINFIMVEGILDTTDITHMDITGTDTDMDVNVVVSVEVARVDTVVLLVHTFLNLTLPNIKRGTLFSFNQHKKCKHKMTTQEKKDSRNSIKIIRAQQTNNISENFGLYRFFPK